MIHLAIGRNSLNSSKRNYRFKTRYRTLNTDLYCYAFGMDVAITIACNLGTKTFKLIWNAITFIYVQQAPSTTQVFQPIRLSCSISFASVAATRTEVENLLPCS